MPRYESTTTTISAEAFNKLKALTHYICCECDPDDLGATKLNKALWYADAEWYLEHGEPLTGETYIKRQRGPMSKHFYEVIKSLQDDGSIMTRGVEYHGYNKMEYIPFKKADISQFLPEQISMVDKVIHHVCRENTAKSISLKSHDAIWEMAEIGEEIPLYAILGATLGEITERDLEWARGMLLTKQTSAA